MKSEELFEIDRQINQIKRSLEQRQEKVTEWNVPLNQILKDRSNKDFYLSKKYTQSNLDFYLNQQIELPEAKSLLQQHNQNTRDKVLMYKNDLRELNQLLKKRNIFRLNKINRFSSTMSKNEKKQNSIKKQFSKTNYESSHELANRKNDREHLVLSNIKGDKLLEVYQEGKQKSGINQQATLHLKRYLGLGIQNTPFYGWCQKKKTTQKKIIRKSTSKKMIQKKDKRPFQLQQQLMRQAQQKKSIYLSINNDKKQQFEQRLKNIIRFNREGIQKLTASKFYRQS